MGNGLPVKQFLHRQWFLIALAVVIFVGLRFPSPLGPLAEMRILRSCIVAGVLLLMALPLEFEVVWRVLRRPWAAALAVAINFGFVPLLAWGVSHGLRGELAVGMLVAGATPCTLASAALWTRKAGGNDAVSILATVFTNLTCFFVTPLWLLVTTGSGEVKIPFGEMTAKLGLLVVLPIVAAQLLRLHRPLGRWATRRTTSLSTAAQWGILCIVLIGSIQSGVKLASLAPRDCLTLRDVATMIGAVLGVHLAALATGHGLGRLLGMDRANRIAVGFAGSQKTVVIGLHVATTYYVGLAILPMVAYHVGQLIVDTVIADRLRRAKQSSP